MKMAGDRVREAEASRRTAETDVRVRVVVDGRGLADVQTGVGFFDHMLAAFARVALCDLQVRASGDLAVEPHHTVEDVGIVLGRALGAAVGDRKGTRRYGSAFVPMDDALARAVLDLSGRPYLAWGPDLAVRDLGGFATDLAEEFWRALATNAGWTLHVDLVRYRNAHHALEAIWKAAGLAFREAAARDGRFEGVLSTKEVLD